MKPDVPNLNSRTFYWLRRGVATFLPVCGCLCVCVWGGCRYMCEVVSHTTFASIVFSRSAEDAEQVCMYVCDSGGRVASGMFVTF